MRLPNFDIKILRNSSYDIKVQSTIRECIRYYFTMISIRSKLVKKN